MLARARDGQGVTGSHPPIRPRRPVHEAVPRLLPFSLLLLALLALPLTHHRLLLLLLLFPLRLLLLCLVVFENSAARMHEHRENTMFHRPMAVLYDVISTVTEFMVSTKSPFSTMFHRPMAVRQQN
jgi:hypothetical protein